MLAHQGFILKIVARSEVHIDKNWGQESDKKFVIEQYWFCIVWLKRSKNSSPPNESLYAVTGLAV